MRRTFLLIVLSSEIALSGCTAGPPRHEPPALSPEQSATIVGSKIHNDNPFSPDVRAYLLAVDQARTTPAGWDHETTLTSGRHLLVWGVSAKAFLHDAWGYGRADVVIEPGKTYTIRSTVPVELSGKCARVETWLETNRTPVTERIPVMVVTWTGTETMVGGVFLSSPSLGSCPSP